MTTTFSYDGLCRVKERVTGDGATNYLRVSTTFNRQGRLDTKKSYAGVRKVQDYFYQYDGNGNITDILDMTKSDWVHYEYGYDEMNQLVSVEKNSAQIERYWYDGRGNISDTGGFDTGGAKEVYDPDTNRLLRDERCIYDYDGNGSMTLKDCRYAPGTDNTQANDDPVKYEYEWDWRDRLIEAKVYKGAPGSHEFTIKFGYDGTGRRIWREKLAADGTRLDLEKYVYDGANVLQDYDADNNVKARYVMNGVDNIYYVMRGGHKYFYHTNHLGSVVAITDEDGDVVNSYDYTDSWGNFDLSCPSEGIGKPCIPNRYVFTSREWDENLEMYYYRARWYSSDEGRFLGEDTDLWNYSPSNYMKYVYCANNPIRYVDKLGLYYWPPPAGGNVVNYSDDPIYIYGDLPGEENYFIGESSWYEVPDAKEEKRRFLFWEYNATVPGREPAHVDADWVKVGDKWHKAKPGTFVDKDGNVHNYGEEATKEEQEYLDNSLKEYKEEQESGGSCE